MEEKKLNELNDEKLDQVAGGGRHGRHSDYGASMTILGHTISTPTELNSFVYGELAFEEKYRGRDTKTCLITTPCERENSCVFILTADSVQMCFLNGTCDTFIYPLWCSQPMLFTSFPAVQGKSVGHLLFFSD